MVYRSVTPMLKKILFAVLISSLNAIPAFAQNSELTATDSHTLLYSGKLEFSADNVPIVRMRIADVAGALTFTPEADFDVLPAGRGGAKVTLPGGRKYSARLSSAKNGSYRYAVILARADAPSQFPEVMQYCARHDIDAEVISVGASFAVRGTLFDSRENLLVTRRSSSLRDAKDAQKTVKLPEALATGRDSELPDIYAEVLNYPTGSVELANEKLGIRVSNKNLLWFDFGNDSAVLHDIAGEDGKTADLRLSGQIVVSPAPDGLLSVAQSADVETLLRGIVPAEIYASAPQAALEAQAIAARTTLLAQVGARHLSDPYHLCNRQHCQVYRGLTGADARTDLAIKNTRGQVLASGSKLAQTYYSAHCGGISAGRAETWGLADKDYLPARTDTPEAAPADFKNEDEFRAWLDSPSRAFCGGAPKGQKDFSSVKHARWTSSVTAADIEQALKKAGARIGKIKDAEIIARGAGYRAVKLRITGTEATFDVVRELPIRRFFGGLKSALFVMDIKKKGGFVEKIDFRGAGFGHGVGLCQTGAIGMAQRNFNAADILKHYYPNAKTVTLY